MCDSGFVFAANPSAELSRILAMRFVYFSELHCVILSFLQNQSVHFQSVLRPIGKFFDRGCNGNRCR